MLLWYIQTFFLFSVRCETEVNMALLLPNDTSRLFSVDKLLPALEVGIAHVRQTFLPDVKFNISYADTRCDMDTAMIEAINFRYRGIVHVFLGPVCDYAVAPLARQARYWNTPVVTVGAMASEFREHRQQNYPTLIRAGPVNFNSVAEYISHMFNYFSWRKLKIISERKGHQEVFENFCHIMSVAINTYLNSGSSNISSDYFRSDTKVDVENLLVNEIGNSYGVVVLCASADSVREMMIKANELNFDNGEYVFINVDLFSSTSKTPWYREGDTPDRNRKARKAYESLMTVTVRKPTSPAYRRFSEGVKKRARYNSFNFGEEEVNSFVGAFHDAVILYTLALNETLTNNRSITNGTEITHRMRNRVFQGITGTVSIDNNGDRNTDYSLLDMNPTTGKFEVVANYYGQDKQYVPIPHKRIHWAGNGNSVPPDTPRCGFDGAKCPSETAGGGTSPDGSKTPANVSGNPVLSMLTMVLGAVVGLF